VGGDRVSDALSRPEVGVTARPGSGPGPGTDDGNRTDY
jgi:hypothetical protein